MGCRYIPGIYFPCTPVWNIYFCSNNLRQLGVILPSRTSVVRSFYSGTQNLTSFLYATTSTYIRIYHDKKKRLRTSTAGIHAAVAVAVYVRRNSHIRILATVVSLCVLVSGVRRTPRAPRKRFLFCWHRQDQKLAFARKYTSFRVGCQSRVQRYYLQWAVSQGVKCTSFGVGRCQSRGQIYCF